jgi:hypothetical protein
LGCRSSISSATFSDKLEEIKKSRANVEMSTCLNSNYMMEVEQFDLLKDKFLALPCINLNTCQYYGHEYCQLWHTIEVTYKNASYKSRVQLSCRDIGTVSGRSRYTQEALRYHVLETNYFLHKFDPTVRPYPLRCLMAARSLTILDELVWQPEAGFEEVWSQQLLPSFRCRGSGDLAPPSAAEVKHVEDISVPIFIVRM